jgi:hypothetical protein
MGWRDDPAYVAAYNALDAPGRDVKELIPQLQALLPPSEPLQLEEFLEHAVAVANERGEYSYKEVILKAAQQIGTSHEDSHIEELLDDFRGPAGSSSPPAFLKPLMKITESVLWIGAGLFAHAAVKHGYKPRHYTLDIRPKSATQASWSMTLKEE